MHQLQSRTYVGQPGEVVTLGTQVDGGGQITIALDGQPLAGNTFPLPQTAGAHSRLQVALLGPIGASCVVTIAVVDGASDGDLLLCQPHDPAPVHFYSMSVADANAITALAAVRNVAVAPASHQKKLEATPRVHRAGKGGKR